MIVLLALGVILAGCGTGARGAAGAGMLAARITSSAAVPGTGAPAEAPCGAAAAHTTAREALLAASRIYGLELQSDEVRSDQREVAGYQPLLRAITAGNRVALQKAVTHLVYSHTHIVRLRIERGGSVLYDLGGAYSIAPVRGALRLGGRTIANYTLSVQDDVGYVKLETRYVGAPVLLRVGARPVPIAGMVRRGVSAIPAQGPVEYRGHRFEAISFDAVNVPSRRVQVTLLVAAPPAQLGCRAITLLELENITENIWHRFVAISGSPSSFATTAAALTGAPTFVRDGSRALAGSDGAGPSTLPASGTVSYRGAHYSVTSFTSGKLRIYALLAA